MSERQFFGLLLAGDGLRRLAPKRRKHHDQH